MGEKFLVVLEEIERDHDRVIGYGRTSAGAKVEFPVDETMLLGIVRMLTLSEGASVWVPSEQLRTRQAARDSAVGGTFDGPATPPPPSGRSTPHDRQAVLFLPEPLVASLVAEVLAGDRYDVRIASEVAAIDPDPAPPDVVVLDLIHPGERNAVELARELSQRHPDLGILFLTRLPDARFVGSEIPASKRIAFLNLQSTPDHHRLLEAANAVVERRSGRQYRDDLRPDRPLGDLSNRQLWLLGQLARGHLLSDIATTRGVSERGAQRLLSRTYARLGIAARKSGHARSLAVRRYCDAAGMSPVGLED